MVKMIMGRVLHVDKRGARGVIVDFVGNAYYFDLSTECNLVIQSLERADLVEFRYTVEKGVPIAKTIGKLGRIRNVD